MMLHTNTDQLTWSLITTRCCNSANIKTADTQRHMHSVPLRWLANRRSAHWIRVRTQTGVQTAVWLFLNHRHLQIHPLHHVVLLLKLINGSCQVLVFVCLRVLVHVNLPAWRCVSMFQLVYLNVWLAGFSRWYGWHLRQQKLVSSNYIPNLLLRAVCILSCVEQHTEAFRVGMVCEISAAITQELPWSTSCPTPCF